MPHSSWTLLGSRYVAKYKVLKLREDRYRFGPTGDEADFVVCESNDWALVVAITEDRQVVFIRQYRHGVRQVVLEIPGGLLEAGESPEIAAARELQEETGFVAERVRWLGKVIPNAAINNAWMHVVVAEGCRRIAEPNPDPFEQIEVVLYPLDKIHEMVRDGQIVHALVIAALSVYERRVADRPSTSAAGLSDHLP